MRNLLIGAALAVAAAFGCASAASADNYPIKDATGATHSFCSRLVGGLQYPCHLLFGLNGSSPTPVRTDSFGNVGVNVNTVPLPPGASTEAKQTDTLTALGTMQATLAAGATAANQSAGNASLSLIAAATGAPADPAWSLTGDGTEIAIAKVLAAKAEATRVLLASGITVNLGTLGGGATAANQVAPQGACGSSTCVNFVWRHPTTGAAVDPDSPGGLLGRDGSTLASLTNPFPAQPVAATSGGATSYVFEVAASDNHQTVKNGAGQLYTLQAFSVHTAAQFIRLYDAGTGFNGCNSATGLIWQGLIPASATGAGFVAEFPVGRAFATGLSVCVTGAFGNTNTTAATASVASVNIGYK